MPPALLLGFTFALGAGGALQLPTWQATMPELVPRTQLRAATRLDLVSVNGARSIGPALAGLVIAYLGGVPVVFALYAVCVAFFGVVLLFWRRPKAESENRRERFLPALRAGGRYVWHEPIVRRILLRTILFVAPAVALWALLPLVASQRLGLGADGYGALFAALGLGAILGAFVLGRVRDRLSSSGLLTVAALLYAAGLAVIVLTQSFPAALVILVLAGVAWMAMTSTLAAELQLFLPVWVRARALAVFMLTFTGSMTVGALLWGLVAESFGLQPAFLDRSSRRTGRRRRGSVSARAGDRSPRPRAGRLLAGGATGLRPRAGFRTVIGHGRVHGHPGSGVRLPRSHGPPAPVSTANRGNALGAVPRRRPARPFYRTLQRPILGGTHAPARRAPDRGG